MRVPSTGLDTDSSAGSSNFLASVAAAEAAFRETEVRCRQLLQGLPAAIYTCDADGRVALFNGAAADLWGREPRIGTDLWCGSWRIYRVDGSPLPLDAHSAGVNQGSEFIVRLPVVVGLLRETEESNGESRRMSAKRRIVVVDDNENAAQVLRMLLKALGNEVRTAYDGLAAIELAEQFRPDIILLDIGMPKLNGYETARRIREQPWGEKIVLAALTGWGQEEDKRRARDAGFDHHFVKPVELAVLQKLLSEYEPTGV